MGRRIFRRLLVLFSLCGSAGAMAVGFGELRGQPVLGERLAVGVELLGGEKPLPDAACFRIVPPTGSSDLPWLKKAAFAVRPGNPSLLEIRADSPLREPIIQLAVELGCGYDISRVYVLLASPAVEKPRAGDQPAAVLPPAPAPAIARPSAATPSLPVAPPSRAAPKKMPLPRPAAARADRLTLSGGAGEELSLRLATEFVVRDQQIKEVQRDVLRLEFRMLMAMNEQATTQLAAAEKLRNMESTLLELRQQAAAFAQRVENGGESTAAASAPPAAPVMPRAEVASPAGRLSEWSLYGALLGVLLGLGGWLGWQHYKERNRSREGGGFELDEPHPVAVKPAPVPVTKLDLPLETAVEKGTPVDFELDGGAGGTARATVAEAADAIAPVFETPLPEMPVEVNPVMELADIMLSFGRVKGAAQTLQEYIDNNPQDALQPWIRLMEVYRMAGMRDEFENVARNLNHHFNVEVQAWEGAQAEASAPAGSAEPAAPERPNSLEGMPRLMGKVVELWATGDVVGYLYQLLRDNRGGERVGFAMPVVDDILFLIELKETANRMG